MNSIAAAFTAVKSANDMVSLLRQSELNLSAAEQKMKLADLVGALADIKIQLAEVQELVINKDSRIKELENLLKTQQNLIYEAPYYWLKNGTAKDGPFCQQCIDNNKKTIRLQGLGSPGRWKCHTCSNIYEDENYKAVGFIPLNSSYDHLDHKDQW